MADNTELNAGSGGDVIATDEIGDVKHQRVKVQYGDDGEATDVSAANPLPVWNYALEVERGNIPCCSGFKIYGKNEGINKGSTEDIWGGGGLYTGFPTGAAETLEIRSSSADDVADTGTGAWTVEISDLLDGTGAIMPNVTVSLNGQSWVSLGVQTYRRGRKKEVLTAGSSGVNLGELTLRHTTTTDNIFAVMPIGNNNTAIAGYTVPLGYKLRVNYRHIQLARENGSGGSAKMSIRAREDGGVFVAEVTPTVTNSSPYPDDNTWRTYPELTDIIFRCESVSDNNTTITANLAGILELQ